MTAGGRFPVRARIAHWVTAALVFAALLIGFAMVTSLGSYGAILAVHASIGVTILVVVLVRVVNRFTFRAPTLPDTVGPLERWAVLGSELTMYALLLAQPLIGWAMLSAAGRPPVVFGGVHLPRIAPFDADAYWVLRQAHSVAAYLLVIVIAAHVSAILLHTLTLRDGLLSRMTFGRGPASTEAPTLVDTA